MLSTLRHKGVSRKILWGVAIIIILSFGVFGTAYRLDHTVNSAGKIYGDAIPLRDFQKAYLDSRDEAILNYGDRFFKMGNELNLENEAWTRLILLREVQKRHIRASDKEVAGFIASIPFFQSGGSFNQAVYESIVENPSVFDRRPKDFEDGIRRTLEVRKLFEQVAGPQVISDEDLKKEYIQKNEKIKLSYILFSPDDFSKGLTASDEEAKKYYDGHKAEFLEPPMVNLQYVHLLYPDKATDAQKQSVKKQAEALAGELNPKADFAAVAQKYHAQVKDSGFFTHDEPLLTFAWSPEFVDKIFSMKVGDISNPMEAPDGWQIVKLKERKEAQVPPFERIVAKVKEAVVAQKALEAARAQAEQTLKTIQAQIKTKDFKAIATSLGLKTQDTDSFSRGEYINAPGLIAELQEPSMHMDSEHKLSDVVATSQGPVILYLSQVQPIDEKKYAEEKEDFRQMMMAQRRSQAIGMFINKLKLEANPQPDLKGKIRYE